MKNKNTFLTNTWLCVERFVSDGQTTSLVNKKKCSRTEYIKYLFIIRAYE